MNESTAIEMVFDIAEELAERGDAEQAEILRACVDALYTYEEAPIEESQLYVDTFEAVRAVCARHKVGL